ALERVRRGARLEGAATKDLRTGLLDVRCDGSDLLLVLDGTRAAHDHDFATTDGHVADLHGRAVSATELAGNELVRLHDRRDGFDSGDGSDGALANGVLWPDDPDDGADGAAADLRLQAPLLDAIDNVLNLFLRRIRSGDDDHKR